MTALSAIGQQLRLHRKQRGMSQLDLANASNSTPRYVSFIETGRSRPGRDVILRLAGALNLTLRDTNVLLVSAGLPLAFAEKSLDDEVMKPVQRLIKQVLNKHDPFPAWVLGPGLQFLDSNAAAEKVLPGLVGMPPKDLIDLWCAPSAHANEKERAYNVFQTLQGLKHELFHHPHPVIPELIAQVESYAAAFDHQPVLQEAPVMCPVLMVNGQPIKTLSTVMRFDKAVNVTMSEIRVELIFPADDESEQILRAM